MTNIDIIKIVIVILELIFLTLEIIFYKENKYIKASYMGLLALICCIIIQLLQKWWYCERKWLF